MSSYIGQPIAPPAPKPDRPAPVLHMVSGSDGTSLHFTDAAMYLAYKRDCELLSLRYYKAIREQNGVWAGNQNKFVPDRNHLRPWDSTLMEDRLAAAIARGDL